MSTITPTPVNRLVEINIALKGSNAVPGPIPLMAMGEQVLYQSSDGLVRIEFSGASPFRTDNLPLTSVSGGQPLTLKQSGEFDCRCFLTLQNGQEVGWSIKEENSASGGKHKVTPP
jgi:hypothetical protein